MRAQGRHFFFRLVGWFEIVFPFIRLVIGKFLNSIKDLVNKDKPVNLGYIFCFGLRLFFGLLDLRPANF